MASIPGPDAIERSTLSREQVVRAAIALIDSDGLDALTMRKLAKKLSVYPTALYWHAGSKPQLLALVYRQILSEIDVPPVTALRWEDWIIALARNARAALGHHPDIAANFTTHIQVSASSFTLANAVLSVLERAGFSGEELVDAYSTVIGSIFGWISAEFAMEDADAAADWRDYFQEELRNPDTLNEYPAIANNLELLANSTWMLRWESGVTRPMRRQYEAMLRNMIAGLRAQLQCHG